MIRLFEQKDYEAVLDIERESAFAWTPAQLNASLANSSCLCWVSAVQQQVIGYLLGSIVLDEAELLKIAIRSSDRKKGYGKQLLQFFLNYLKDHRIKVVFLEVRVSNQAALNLYYSAGFSCIGQRKNYYPHPLLGTENAWVLKKELISISK